MAGALSVIVADSLTQAWAIFASIWPIMVLPIALGVLYSIFDIAGGGS